MLVKPAAATTSTRAVGSDRPHLETVAGVLFCVVAGVAGIAPRLLPALIALFAVVMLLDERRRGMLTATLNATAKSSLAIPAAAFLGYALLSALWSADALFAAQSVTQVAVTIVATLYLCHALPPMLAALDPPRRAWFLRGIPIGTLVAIAFLVVETGTGHAITLAVLRVFPALGGDNIKEIIRQGEQLVYLREFFLNRSIAAMVLMGAPLALALALMTGGVRRSIWLGLTGLALAGIVVYSESETAKLGLFAGLATYAASRRWPRHTWLVLAALIVAGTILAMPLARLPHAFGLQHVSSLPISVRERAVIWDYTARAAINRPLFGIGAQSTREVQQQITKARGAIELQPSPGWHAHNFILQAWYELGAVGAALLALLALALNRGAYGLDAAARPFAMALMAATMAIAVTGWGLWQPWLIAAMALPCIALAGLSLETRRNAAHVPG